MHLRFMWDDGYYRPLFVIYCKWHTISDTKFYLFTLTVLYQIFLVFLWATFKLVISCGSWLNCSCYTLRKFSLERTSWKLKSSWWGGSMKAWWQGWALRNDGLWVLNSPPPMNIKGFEIPLTKWKVKIGQIWDYLLALPTKTSRFVRFSTAPGYII